MEKLNRICSKIKKRELPICKRGDTGDKQDDLYDLNNECATNANIIQR